ncbi:unnamed protein product [Euphydryas editha]|uniref:Uncharacterized protein n=1 Tax=Euphydryas editha TaxID=104508 RepID=A0AAU9TWV1_EUPED|nr:unnamed protein product [Euphydryas editha]
MVSYESGFLLLPNCYAYIPNVDDLFKTLTEDNEFDRTIHKPPDTLFKNISINLEKLNLSTFTGKLRNMVGNIGNIIEEDDVIPKGNETRRLAYIGNIYEWRNASKVLVKNKLFDLMLQTIYMARHKIKQVEDEAYYNPADTSYRIAFLYRRIRRIWKKMLDIYTTMERKRLVPRPYSLLPQQ